MLGLFGVTSGATIENLRVEGPLVHGLEQVGGLVGYANGGTVIRNCRFMFMSELLHINIMLVG